MRLILTHFFIALTLSGAPPVLGQTSGGVKKSARVTSPPAGEAAPRPAPPAASQETAASTDGQQDELPVRVYLKGGGRLEVDELTEGPDGYWYRQGGVTALLDRARVERVERGPEGGPAATPAADETTGRWSLNESEKVENFFAARFGRPLPVTAFGQSSLHSRWGLDHRQSLDVGVHPDSREGRTLVEFLRAEGIPFMTFRRPVPGVATAPHIHIGRPSPGLRAR